jgi:SAM-dependent methyltransferase
MRTVDQYVLRVLGDQWTAPSRMPTLLDVSRRGDAIAAELARAGFRVTRVAQEASSLETVSERLAAMHRHFDAVVVRDVLERQADWREVVSRAARRVRPGGVFVYGVSTGAAGRWLDRLLPRGLRRRARPMIPAGEMAALLRRSGLLQREMISLAAETLDTTTTTYMGHSIMKGLPHTAMALRWDFTGTGERWMAGARS